MTFLCAFVRRQNVCVVGVVRGRTGTTFGIDYEMAVNRPAMEGVALGRVGGRGWGRLTLAP